MSVTAAHLRELIELGIVGETLVRVVEIIDEASTMSVDKSADVRRGPLESTAEQKRKERDKQRKRAERAAEKAAKLSTKSSEDKSEDGPIMDSVLLPSLITSFLPEEPLKKESSGIRARARGTRMEPGTPLSEEHRALILSEGISDPEKLWAEFVDYWSDIPGQRGVKVKWTGTLRNRCRDVITRGFNRPQGQNNGRRTVHDAANDLLERVQAFDEPAPSGIRGGTFQGPLRLLPPR